MDRLAGCRLDPPPPGKAGPVSLSGGVHRRWYATVDFAARERGRGMLGGQHRARQAGLPPSCLVDSRFRINWRVRWGLRTATSTPQPAEPTQTGEMASNEVSFWVYVSWFGGGGVGPCGGKSLLRNFEVVNLSFFRQKQFLFDSLLSALQSRLHRRTGGMNLESAPLGNNRPGGGGTAFCRIRVFLLADHVRRVVAGVGVFPSRSHLRGRR